MPQFRDRPWRCWERLTLPAVLNGPERLLVRVALENTANGLYQPEFRWPSLVRLGPNDYSGKYAQITLRFGEAIWSFEMAAEGSVVYILVRHISGPAENVEVHLETLYQDPHAGQLFAREDEVIARGQMHSWKIFSPSPTAHREGTTITAPLKRPFMALIHPEDERAVRPEFRTEGERVPSGPGAPFTRLEQELASDISRIRFDYQARFEHVPDEFWWAYAGVPYGIGWNTIYAADKQEALQVCSRDWCVHDNYGGWVLFNWDTFLLAVAAADYDPALAHQMFRTQLSFQTSEGLVPGVASPLGISADRSMPPVAAFSVWKAYLRTNDRSFVEDYFDALLRYHYWWRTHRDGNHDGLLEWGSNALPPPHPQWQAHTIWASRYETGMDNHPMWDDVTFNKTTGTQEQSDIGLNALHAVDARCLSKMAEMLGHPGEAARLQEEAASLGRRIDTDLWNKEIALWLSRKWSNEWNYRASPTCLYPLFIPETEPDHVEKAVKFHLLNPRRFGGKYAMPVCPRDDPAYVQQYYVRGRIWPPQMLLVHAALREAGREEAAAELANGALETMRHEWLDKGHLHENYHAETAEGDDTRESDPLYSFGIMLPLIGWYHLRDVLIDGTVTEADLQSLAANLDPTGELRARITPLDSLPPIA